MSRRSPIWDAYDKGSRSQTAESQEEVPQANNEEIPVQETGDDHGNGECITLCASVYNYSVSTSPSLWFQDLFKMMTRKLKVMIRGLEMDTKVCVNSS